MSNFEIGLIQPVEWEKYREFRLKTSKEDPLAWGLTAEEEASFPNEWWMGQLEKAHKKEGLWMFFAICNGQIVGMVAANRIRRKRLNHIVHVNSVSVDKDFRGQGVATKLIGMMMQELEKEPNVLVAQIAVVSSQSIALTLYKKFGFEIAGIRKKVFRHGEKFYDEVLMEKMF